jgi:hypothetical protein
MILKNQFNDIQLVSSSLLECFDNITWEKKISIWNWTNRYASVVHSSNVNYEIETVQENWETDFFFICPINEKKPSSLHLTFNIKHSWVKLNVHIVALVSENIPITIDADIIMQEWVQKSSASLLEESILLSKNVNIKSLPVLDIHSKNIQASHWAKIQRISAKRLFYMQSRWLSEEKAINMIINSYSEQIIDKLELNEKEKSEFYSMIQ